MKKISKYKVDDPDKTILIMSRQEENLVLGVDREALEKINEIEQRYNGLENFTFDDEVNAIAFSKFKEDQYHEYYQPAGEIQIKIRDVKWFLYRVLYNETD